MCIVGECVVSCVLSPMYMRAHLYMLVHARDMCALTRVSIRTCAYARTSTQCRLE